MPKKRIIDQAEARVEEILQRISSVQTAANFKKNAPSGKEVVAMGPQLYKLARQEILGLLADLDAFAEANWFKKP